MGRSVSEVVGFFSKEDIKTISTRKTLRLCPPEAANRKSFLTRELLGDRVILYVFSI